jgi:hypothetical protein
MIGKRGEKQMLGQTKTFPKTVVTKTAINTACIWLFAQVLGQVLMQISANGAIAQVSKPVTESQQALQELRQDTSGTVFSSTSSANNLMQLIHNANLLNGKSPEKFNSEQSETLNDTVKAFKERQRQQLGNIQPGTTSPSAPSLK